MPKTVAEFLNEARAEKDVSSVDISNFVTSMQNLISSYKRNHLPAADLYHETVMKGQLLHWLEKNAVPIWKKHGYPIIGEPAWVKVQDEFVKSFLIKK